MSIPTTGSTSSSTIEASNPLFLSPSDNPSTVLVSKVFDGSGFSMWKRSMMLALSAKNKFGFVDGSTERPNETSETFHNWNRVNSMVISWLLNSLSKDIAESVMFLQTAKDIWSELNQRYEQSNGALIYQIQKQLFSINQGTDDFSTYFTKIKRIWDELKSIHEIPNCTCGTATQMNKFIEEQRLIQLLMGLNDSYKAIRGQILMMTPLPSISTVHSLLIHEERQRDISSGSQINVEAMAMNVQSNNKKNLQCSYCKKSGHIKSQCYRLNGFPADFKFNKSKKVDSQAHNAADNNQNISPEQYKQLIQLLNNNTAQVNSVITNGAMDSAGNYTDSYGRHVSYIFNVYDNNTQENKTWIIDSGATDHICANKSMFTSLESFDKPHLIGLPNGQSLHLSQNGTVPIHETVVLPQVLYLPEFKHNLISVAKITI